MESNGGSQDEPVNKYMALRDAKIARNQARLKELGLDSFTSRTLTVANLTLPQRSTAINTRTQKTEVPVVRVVPEAPILPQRRSERKRSLPETYLYSTDRKSSLSRNETLNKPFRYSTTPIATSTSTTTSTTTTTGTPALAPLSIAQLKQHDTDWRLSSSSLQAKLLPQRGGAVSKFSARAMNIDVQQLLFGSTKDKNDDNDGCLGKTMERTGKSYVMDESARRSVAIDQYPTHGGTVSFNKYSGVQEWGNDVLFLWINLGTPNSDVRNDFPNEGRQVTWYGGSQMHDQTNVIVKLKRVGMQIAEAGSGADAGDIRARTGGSITTISASARTDQAIVLWCRKYEDSRKTFGPYVCFGRLSLVSYDPTSRPLAFVWQLVDYEELSTHKDNIVRDTFRTMIGNR